MESQMSIPEKEKRIREYKSDVIIEYFRKMIFNAAVFAKPRIMVCLDDPSKSIYDIDEDSKRVIEYWTLKMEEYILYTYPDIITKTQGNDKI